MTADRPRVLVVSINAWREGSGIRTLMDLFRHWGVDRLAQLYTRSALPDTQICRRFFRISEDAVMRSVLLRRTETGMDIRGVPSGSRAEGVTSSAETSRYRLGHSFILTIARDLVWLSGVWKSPALDHFLEDYDPEVLFLPVYPTLYMGWIQLHVLRRTGRPAVCYITDDNYTYAPCGMDPVRLVHRYFLRKVVRRLVAASDQVFVIVPKMKRELDLALGIESALLTRGIDFSGKSEICSRVHSPVRLVYTGKLILDRWKSLSLIVRALEEVNRDAVRATLDIYSPDVPTRIQRKALDSPMCFLRGAVSADEVEGIQSNADILIFVEALSGRYRNAARLSFSTKLTDYMRSGRCILAVGAEDWDQLTTSVQSMLPSASLRLTRLRRCWRGSYPLHPRLLRSGATPRSAAGAIMMRRKSADDSTAR
jgi:hypothetical protein